MNSMVLLVKSNITLKDFLLENGFSKRAVSKLLSEKKNVYINDVLYGKNFYLKSGDKVKITVNEKTTVKSVDKDIEIVYEDEYMLIVFKPKNLAVIPTKAHIEDNLAGRVKNYFEKTEQSVGIHVVNRLDLMTCGLVIFAKSNFYHNAIIKCKIEKKYLALVQGVLENKSGTISEKIQKSEHGILREISKNGKNATTQYKVVKEDNGNSLVDISLLTGRTHQIRVHFKSINHPLVGDTLYGGIKGDFYLIAYSLKFRFPLNGKDYSFSIKK